MKTLMLFTLLAIAGCSQAPTTPAPVLSGYEPTPEGCRDLATGKYVASSNCDPKAAP